MKDGKYSEKLTLKEGIKLYGESKDVVITDAIIMQDDTLIKNLTVSGGYHSVTITNDADAQIDDCIIKNSGYIAINMEAGGGRVIVRDSNLYGSSGKSIYAQKGRKIELSNNEVHNNNQEGIDLRDRVNGTVNKNKVYANGESGIEVIIGGAEVSIISNTITNNKASGIAAQYYKDMPSVGRVDILGNNISNNNKYGLDCNIPSGGTAPADYWTSSLKFGENSFASNKMGETNPFCKIGKEEKKEEEKKEEKPKEIGQEQQQISAEEIEKNNRERQQRGEDFLELVDKAEGWKTRVEEKIAAIEKRGKIETFIFGEDYRGVDFLRSSLLELDNLSGNLNQMAKNNSYVDYKYQLENKMTELETKKKEVEKVILENEDKFSLLGWLLKLIN